MGGAKRSFLVAAGAKTKRYFPISLYDYCSIIMKTNTIMMMTRSIAVMTIFMRLIQGERKQFLEGGRLQQSVRGHDDRYHHHPRHHHHHHCHDHHYHDHDHDHDDDNAQGGEEERMRRLRFSSTMTLLRLLMSWQGRLVLVVGCVGSL